MREDCDLDTVGPVLADDTTRAILAETSVEPMTAAELIDRLEASKPTVYRRLNDLEERDLLTARIIPDESGHHVKVYRAGFRRVTIDLEEGEYTCTLERPEEMAQRLKRFIERL